MELHNTREQARETAINKTIVHVGEKLLRGKAMLLPDAHNFFIEKHEEILAAFDLLEHKTDTQKSVTCTSHWVLSNLNVALYTASSDLCM